MNWAAVIGAAIDGLVRLLPPFFAWFAGKKAGRNEAQDALRDEALRVKNEQLEAANNAPRSRDDLSKRLRNGKF